MDIPYAAMTLPCVNAEVEVTDTTDNTDQSDVTDGGGDMII